MKIEVLDPQGHNIMTLQFHLLDCNNISRGRHILIRSVASQHGFNCGTSIRKDAKGIAYVEVKMRVETKEKELSLFTRQIVKELV